MKNGLLVIVSALVFVSCYNISGSGNIVNEKRQVGSFKGISTGGAYEVELRKGPSVEVEVESDDNVIKYIETSVEGDVLEIRKKGGGNFMNTHTKIFVTVPEINLLKCSGAASIKTTDVFKSDGKIRLETSGASDVEVQVDAPEVSAKSSGASSIKLGGRTRDYNAAASGSADIKSSGLMTENSVIKASGAADVHVHASVKLNAEASGSASIYYRGGAAVSQKTSGAADVKKED
jgi:hypothetical protein